MFFKFDNSSWFILNIEDIQYIKILNDIFIGIKLKSENTEYRLEYLSNDTLLNDYKKLQNFLDRYNLLKFNQNIA